MIDPGSSEFPSTPIKPPQKNTSPTLDQMWGNKSPAATTIVRDTLNVGPGNSDFLHINFAKPPDELKLLSGLLTQMGAGRVNSQVNRAVGQVLYHCRKDQKDNATWKGIKAEEEMPTEPLLQNIKKIVDSIPTTSSEQDIQATQRYIIDMGVATALSCGSVQTAVDLIEHSSDLIYPEAAGESSASRTTRLFSYARDAYSHLPDSSLTNKLNSALGKSNLQSLKELVKPPAPVTTAPLA